MMNFCKTNLNQTTAIHKTNSGVERVNVISSGATFKHNIPNIIIKVL
jgi:hypothetical protein